MFLQTSEDLFGCCHGLHFFLQTSQILDKTWEEVSYAKIWRNVRTDHLVYLLSAALVAFVILRARPRSTSGTSADERLLA